MQPTEIYLKSKRSLLIFSGILLLSITIGLKYDNQTNGTYFLPVSVEDSGYLNYVFGALALYFSVQLALFWAAQNQEVKELIQYKIDFYLTELIGVASIVIFSVVETSKALDDDYISLDFTLITFSMIASLMATFAFAMLARSIVVHSRTSRQLSETKILDMLMNRDWVLNFNPESSRGRKDISFEPDGEIGDGVNDNERKWRLRGEFLEILNWNGQVFSRFKYDNEKDIFIHTNDDDTLSIRSQQIFPKSQNN